ncbi:Tautomerase/MIF [Cylindrobasidium torrendii FP15055 ss-10]|uniref:L-dopachrome isomerase n=1 Tax=Cylindrobasidium torrendii FP15055 ss-10 TaxID=1314674 RepID=A0A0D7BG60_9AGAR|nr:Tautomerase/MIF [Cylindrobasidium torrendii FP15055 ss-10]
MPSLELKTSAKVPDLEKFLLEFSKEGARILGKPEAYITTSVSPLPLMTFAGTTEPAFTLLVISLGNITPEKNEVYSKELSEFLQSKLGLSPERGYITFLDPGNDYLGYKGTTFGTIFGR